MKPSIVIESHYHLSTLDIVGLSYYHLSWEFLILPIFLIILSVMSFLCTTLTEEELLTWVLRNK